MNATTISDGETGLVRVLDDASRAVLACSNKSTNYDTVWQLTSVAMRLRDRMQGISGGTVIIAPKAIDTCIDAVKKVTQAANDDANGPDFDRVVTQGNAAIDVIDRSDTKRKT